MPHEPASRSGHRALRWVGLLPRGQERSRRGGGRGRGANHDSSASATGGNPANSTEGDGGAGPADVGPLPTRNSISSDDAQRPHAVRASTFHRYGWFATRMTLIRKRDRRVGGFRLEHRRAAGAEQGRSIAIGTGDGRPSQCCCLGDIAHRGKQRRCRPRRDRRPAMLLAARSAGPDQQQKGCRRRERAKARQKISA